MDISLEKIQLLDQLTQSSCVALIVAVMSQQKGAWHISLANMYDCNTLVTIACHLLLSTDIFMFTEILFMEHGYVCDQCMDTIFMILFLLVHNLLISGQEVSFRVPQLVRIYISRLTPRWVSVETAKLLV